MLYAALAQKYNRIQIYKYYFVHTDFLVFFFVDLSNIDIIIIEFVVGTVLIYSHSLKSL